MHYKILRAPRWQSIEGLEIICPFSFRKWVAVNPFWDTMLMIPEFCVFRVAYFLHFVVYFCEYMPDVTSTIISIILHDNIHVFCYIRTYICKWSNCRRGNWGIQRNWCYTVHICRVLQMHLTQICIEAQTVDFCWFTGNILLRRMGFLGLPRHSSCRDSDRKALTAST